MPDARPEVLDFLLTRRSRPAKTLTGPVPDRTALRPMLEAAARVPDHGKLEPWRFIVLEGAALARVAAVAAARADAMGYPPERVAKTAVMFTEAPLIVAVIAMPRPTEKVPAGEQVLSAGAVCLSLLNAALASGWGANWLTGPMADDAEFLSAALEVGEPDFCAGFVVIGTETTPPPDRPRPDIDAITTWLAD
ncbi:nitroreductase family protein [Algicella marina]|uniref:Putative NAD(P)H nitroreductase n=1 Tax=Algicella marina TaxID=2683284 RepID=A0A6P1SZG4_9RHOB|nr:nitroreductase [Algicella marina]QHQ36084.1 nitroreductase [Algicella marina]